MGRRSIYSCLILLWYVHPSTKTRAKSAGVRVLKLLVALNHLMCCVNLFSFFSFLLYALFGRDSPSDPWSTQVYRTYVTAKSVTMWRHSAFGVAYCHTGRGGVFFSGLEPPLAMVSQSLGVKSWDEWDTGKLVLDTHHQVNVFDWDHEYTSIYIYIYICMHIYKLFVDRMTCFFVFILFFLLCPPYIRFLRLRSP